jgi:hypothetical protein
MNDKIEPGISHFEGVKGKESGKTCTLIKLRLKFMKNATISGGFRSMLATLSQDQYSESTGFTPGSMLF